MPVSQSFGLLPATMPRSDVPGILNFTEIVGVDPTDPDGLIPLAVSLRPLECRIPQWIPGPSPGRTHTLKLIWTVRGVAVEADSREFIGPLNPADFPVSLFVPADFMRELDAVVDLHYEILTDGGITTPALPARRLTVDNNWPDWLHPSHQLTFVDPNIDVTGITDDVLNANPFIEVLVPGYRGRVGRDKVAFYLSNTNPPFPLRQTGEQVFFFADEPLILRVPADAFRTLANGTAYLSGRLYDRAGNFSGLSAPKDFQVRLTALPSNLPRPVIRFPAYEDFLINREDARRSVIAEISRVYDGYAPGDEVVMYWNGRAVLPAQPVDRFPFPVVIPWNILRGTAPLVREEVPVRYEIRRGVQPPVPSPSGFFWVDLTIAGQDHANAPERLNITLERVEVFGLGSGLRDELDFSDGVAGAQVWVRLYVNPQPGEQLALYWNNGAAPVAHYTVQAGDVTGQPVRFLPDVAGSVIIREGNHPALPVHYTTYNGVNVQDAPATPVNVHVAPLHKLNAPLIQHTLHGPALYLVCESRPAICHGVRWLVAPDPWFELNDEIEFFWQGFSSNNGERPISDTDFSETHSLNANQLRDGLVVTVLPWEKIEPMRQYASATAAFYVRRRGALLAESGEALVRIDRTSSGTTPPCQPGDTGFCDGTLEDFPGEP